jgi:hypothetical protein
MKIAVGITCAVARAGDTAGKHPALPVTSVQSVPGCGRRAAGRTGADRALGRDARLAAIIKAIGGGQE